MPLPLRRMVQLMHPSAWNSDIITIDHKKFCALHKKNRQLHLPADGRSMAGNDNQISIDELLRPIRCGERHRVDTLARRDRHGSMPRRQLLRFADNYPGQILNVALPSHHPCREDPGPWHRGQRDG